MSVPVAPVASGPAPSPPLIWRMAGVLRRPRSTFAGVIAEPRVAGILAVPAALAAAAGAALMSTDVGRLALVDQWERTAFAFGRPVNDAEYGALFQLSEAGPIYAVGAAMMAGPVLTTVVALVAYAVFNRRAANRSFRQVLAVAGHAGVILALRQVIAAPVGYVRETTASATTLGVWFPMLDEVSPAARFFGLVDGFIVWWAVVLAMGLAQLYGRPPRRMALEFVGVYAGLALVMAAAMAATGGTV
jgi:hypothetical protein